MKAGNLRISGFLFSQERVVAGSGILQRRLPAEAFAQQTEHKLARTNALCAGSIPNQNTAVTAATASTMMPNTMR